MRPLSSYIDERTHGIKSAPERDKRVVVGIRKSFDMMRMLKFEEGGKPPAMLEG